MATFITGPTRPSVSLTLHHTGITLAEPQMTDTCTCFAERLILLGPCHWHRGTLVGSVSAAHLFRATEAGRPESH